MIKLYSVIKKNLKEQIRSYWVLLLTFSMGPFFIFVYYLIIQSSNTQYNVLVINNDKGLILDNQEMNYGKELLTFYKEFKTDTAAFPFHIIEATDQSQSIEKVKSKKADALIVIHESFSQSLSGLNKDSISSNSGIEFIGDLTSTNYLISAVYANEIINEFGYYITNTKRIIPTKETALGTSGTINMFDMIVPGILILSTIMLMFTASIAFVAEVEHKTVMRLKLSKLKALEFVGGISVVQTAVGVVSLVLTLLTAIMLGFHFEGSLLIMLFIASLVCLSIVGFGLIIAAITKSAVEVLIIGNFPMFLFMFFTGAAFPLKTNALFTIAGYPIGFEGLMTPTHAISALNKTLVMNMDIGSIIPEIMAMILLTILYFLLGAMLFRFRHLRLA